MRGRSFSVLNIANKQGRVVGQKVAEKYGVPVAHGAKQAKRTFSVGTVVLFSLLGPIFGALGFFLCLFFFSPPTPPMGPVSLSRRIGGLLILFTIGLPLVLPFAIATGLPFALPAGIFAAIIRRYSKSNWHYFFGVVLTGTLTVALPMLVIAGGHIESIDASMVVAGFFGSVCCALLYPLLPCAAAGRAQEATAPPEKPPAV